VRRLRAGELLAGAGAVALVGVLFMDWFAPLGWALREDAARSGWTTLGWLMVALLVLLVLAALWLVAATVAGAMTQAVAAGVTTAAVGTIAGPVLLVRVLTQPNLGVGAPDSLVDIRWGAALGLLCTAVIAASAWWMLKDERTNAPESRYEPPPPRPAPPPARRRSPGAGTP
jgi:hypothetical protein